MAFDSAHLTVEYVLYAGKPGIIYVHYKSQLIGTFNCIGAMEGQFNSEIWVGDLNSSGYLTRIIADDWEDARRQIRVLAAKLLSSKEDAEPELRAAFDDPATIEDVLAILDKWSDPVVMTFGSKRAERMAQVLRKFLKAQVSDTDRLTHIGYMSQDELENKADRPNPYVCPIELGIHNLPVFVRAGDSGPEPDTKDTDRLNWLQAVAGSSRTGVSIDYDAKEGFRAMKYHLLGDRERDIRLAIDNLKAKMESTEDGPL